jgi:hypothetical protein
MQCCSGKYFVEGPLMAEPPKAARYMASAKREPRKIFEMSGLAYVSFSTFWNPENKLTVECFLADFFHDLPL